MLANCRGSSRKGRVMDSFGWTGGNNHLSQVSRVRKATSGSILVNSALSYRTMQLGIELLLCGIFRPGTPSVLMQGQLIFHFSEVGKKKS